MIKRILIVGLILTMGITFVCSVFAEDANNSEPIVSRYSYALTTKCSIRISGNKAICIGYASSQDYSTNTNVTITLQKKASGTTNWANVCSWSASASGTREAIVRESKTISTGYDYRIQMYWKISNSSGTILENGTEYSNVVSY